LRAIKERNEAREKIERQADRIRYLEGATNHAEGTPLSVALKERDEARNDIIGWENKWRCAVDMAARAELERDEARELAQQMSESNQVLQAEVRDYRKK
jgi:predicted  nucleic acid-binding Zn ribbon protein